MAWMHLKSPFHFEAETKTKRHPNTPWLNDLYVTKRNGEREIYRFRQDSNKVGEWQQMI